MIDWKSWNDEIPIAGKEVLTREWYDGWLYEVIYIGTTDNLVHHVSLEGTPDYSPIEQEIMGGIMWGYIDG